MEEPMSHGLQRQDNEKHAQEVLILKFWGVLQLPFPVVFVLFLSFLKVIILWFFETGSHSVGQVCPGVYSLDWPQIYSHAPASLS